MVSTYDGRAAIDETAEQCASPSARAHDVWEAPSFDELRMDAEVGSYQGDDGLF
jgi:hypothetical protein